MPYVYGNICVDSTHARVCTCLCKHTWLCVDVCTSVCTCMHGCVLTSRTGLANAKGAGPIFKELKICYSVSIFMLLLIMIRPVNNYNVGMLLKVKALLLHTRSPLIDLPDQFRVAAHSCIAVVNLLI